MTEHAEVRKVVTVLFCDVVGYTSRAESLDPEAVRLLQQRYFDTARGALERHGGTVEKFIGDAVMAVFGVPRLHEMTPCGPFGRQSTCATASRDSGSTRGSASRAAKSSRRRATRSSRAMP